MTTGEPSTDYADNSFGGNLRNVWIKALLLLVFAFPLQCAAQQGAATIAEIAGQIPVDHAEHEVAAEPQVHIAAGELLLREILDHGLVAQERRPDAGVLEQAGVTEKLDVIELRPRHAPIIGRAPARATCPEVIVRPGGLDPDGPCARLPLTSS